MALSDLLQGCSNKSDTVMIQQDIATNLTKQGSSNIVIHDCNSLVESFRVSPRPLYQINAIIAKSSHTVENTHSSHSYIFFKRYRGKQLFRSYNTCGFYY